MTRSRISTRRIGVSVALATAMAVTTTPSQVLAAGPMTADALAVKGAVQSLSVALGDLATVPTLQAPLPVAGQSVADLLGLHRAFAGSLGAAAGTFTGTTLDELVKALDESDTSELGVRVTKSDDGSELTVELTNKPVDTTLYILHADDTLFLDGTNGDKGSVPVTGGVAGTLTLHVSDGDTPAVTLDPASTLSISLKGSRDGLSLPSRYGFSDVTAAGSASYDVQTAISFTDPDGIGGITQAEWQQTLLSDLAPSTVSGSAALDLTLDSDLVSGSDDGTVSSSLSTATDMIPSDVGDGSYRFPEPTITVGTGLTDLAKIGAGDAIVGLAQMAAAYTNAQARIDPRLPLVDTSVSELGSAVEPLNELVESQGAAAVTCGRTDTSPPQATTVPGTTWYCQARTAEAVTGPVQWKVLSGGGTISANGTSAQTIGQSPTANVAITGSATEPEVAVEFEVAGGDGTTFTAMRRVRTAQELAARLSSLPGGATTTPVYDASTRALTFPISSDSDPAAQELTLALGDMFRNDARLRGIETTSKLGVNLGKVAMQGTLGLLLGPDAGSSVAERAFVRVAGSEPEVSVAGISTTGGTMTGTGSVGFLGVNLAGSGISLSTPSSTDPAFAADINASGSLAEGAITDAALLADILAGEGDPASVTTTGSVTFDAGATLTATAPQLPSGKSYTAAMAYDVDLEDTLVDAAGPPTVTPSADWKSWLAAQDVAPQVSGFATSGGSAATLTDSGANFLTGLLGPTLNSGDVVALSLVNLRTGASCSAFTVAEHSLTCAEQTQTGELDNSAGWQASTMAGGKVEDPTKLADTDNTNNYKSDNEWQTGDPYLIEGDPTATRGMVLSGLFGVADSIEKSEATTWRAPVPVLGLTPHDLVPQLDKIRTVATKLNTLADEVRPEGCGDSCPPASTLDKAPADVAALVTALQKELVAVLPGAKATIGIQQVDGEPAMVLDVTAPASGRAEIPLSFALQGGTEYWLRRAVDVPGDTTTLKADWSSKVRIKVAVPTTPGVPYSDVKVLPGTGVEELTMTVDSTTVDLNAGLGPVDVKVGTSGALKGTTVEPTDPSPLVRVDSAVVVAGKSSTAGSTLTDTEVKLSTLAGTSTTATRTSDTASCTGSAASGDGLLCDLPKDTTVDPAVERDWAVGDAYTLTYTSSTLMTDTSLDLVAASVKPGDVLLTYTGSGDSRTTTGTCLIMTVSKHQVECTAPLTSGGTFTSGTKYRVVQNVLMAPGAGFDQAEIEGSTVTNTTDQSSCVVASAAEDYLVCELPGLAGGTRNYWVPGDQYEVPGEAIVKADLGFTFLGDTTALLTPYVGSMTAKLADGPGAPVACGSFSGAACAAVSVRTQPTDDRPDGSYLGNARIEVAVADDGTVTETTSVANAVKNLDDGTTPLALGSLGDAFSDAGQAITELSADSTTESQLPLVGDDPMAGSWLLPLVDAFGAELGEKLMSAALSDLPEDTPLNDLDANGTTGDTLPAALQAAVKNATEALTTPAGDPMADHTAAVAQVYCGTSECNLASHTIGDVTDIKLPIKLGKTATYQVPFQVGLAGLPLSADFRVNSAVTWSLDVLVGIDRVTGPYIDLDKSTVNVDAEVTMPDGSEGWNCPTSPVTGAFDAKSPFGDYNPDSCQALTVGLLQATAYDGKGANRSKASIDFTLDLDKAVTEGGTTLAAGELADLTTSQKLAKGGIQLEASGRFNVYFVTGLNPRFTTLQSGSLPSVHGILDVKFNPSEKNIWDIDFDKDWSIDYHSLYLDAGSFANNFAGDVIGGVAKNVKPYKPLIDQVRAPVPVLSDIASLMGKPPVTLIDILEKSSGSDLSFVRKVIEVLDVVSRIERTDKNLLIPLGATPPPPYDAVTWPSIDIPPVSAAGSFKARPKQSKNGPCGGTMTSNPNPSNSGANGVGADGTQKSPAATSTTRRMPKDCTSTDKGGGVIRGKTKVIQTQPCSPTGGCTGKERAATISAAVNRPKLTGTAISFPFLEDFSEIFGLLLGEDATIVRLDLGTLRASAGIGLTFGPFMAGPVPVDIGIGLSVTFGAHLAMGYDTVGLRNALLSEPGEFNPSALLDGFYLDDYDANGVETPEMTLTLTIQLEGSVSVKILKMGVYGGVSITIAGDLNDPNKDGRLRIEEIRSYGDDPLCLFELSGWLDFFFGFFVELDLWIKKFRYNVELFRLKPPIKLFEIKCEPKPPVLAVVEGGNLRLKMGTHATGRNVSESEPKEKFRLRQLSPRDGLAGGGTLVSIEAFGIYQEKVVPAGGRIVADASGGDDTVELQPGVDLQNNTHLFDVPATVNGGEGNDSLTGSLGNDTLHGDGGDDRVSGNAGDDTLNGGEGADIVSGGLGNDGITTAGGNDIASGDAGGDTIDGGDGNDQVSGGPGLSKEEFDKLHLRWKNNPNKDKLPEPQAGLKDLADTLAGGGGNDQVTGHVGNDILYGDGSVTGSFRTDACADDAGTATGADVLDGQMGDDWLAGGPGSDALTGAEGADTLCGNGGADLLEGDEGPANAGTGKDELRGGSGDDRGYGRGGADFADGGPGDDLLITGDSADIVLGGTGADALNAGNDGDIVLGDTGTVSGVEFNSAIDPSRAGVQSTGLTGIVSGVDRGSKVSGTDSAGTSGSVTACLPRVVLLKGSGSGPQGKADLNGDGSVSAADAGRLDGFPVIAGQVDVDASNTVDDNDTGVVAGLVVNAGRFDIPADQSVDALGWKGTGDADCLFSHDGNDAVFGGAGGDAVLTGSGADLAVGGAGGDQVRGEDGIDVLRGGTEGDVIHGDAGADTILGNAGDDTAYGGTDADRVEGNEDTDTLYGGEAADVLVGGSTSAGPADSGDTVYGGEAADWIAGDNAAPVTQDGSVLGLHLYDVTDPVAAGADTLRGGTHNDRIYGQGGADSIFGESDADTAEGGPGADTVHGDSGADFVTGGSGTDLRLDGTERTWAATNDTGDFLYGDADADVILGDNGVAGRSELFDVPIAPDSPAAGSSGDDVISGGDGADRVFAQSGNDTVTGDADDDVVDGNSGADDISGGDGADDLVGGSSQNGLSTLPGTDVDDRQRTVDGQLRGDLVDGDGGIDTILGDNGRVDSDRTTPTARKVTLYDVPFLGGTVSAHAAGGDVLNGGTEEDRIYGQSGNDTIHGDDARDVAEGNAGADDIWGDAGTDDLIGGSTVAGVDDAAVGAAGAERGDWIRGGSEEDVALGDNGSVSTDDAREVTQFDVEYAAAAERFAGASGPDDIWGNSDEDRLFGQGGDDRVFGGAQDDEMAGDSGADTLRGGSGSDDIAGGSGPAQFPEDLAGVLDSGDKIRGGGADGDGDDGSADGADVIVGDNGRITRDGLLDVNTLAPERKVVLFDLVTVGEGTSAVVGASAGDRISGDDARDLVYAQGGNDVVHGDSGDDWLEGNGDDDTVRGGDGDDDVLGGSSSDVRSGLPTSGRVGVPGEGGFPTNPNKLLDGDDQLWGDAGNDAVVGDNATIDRPESVLTAGWLYLDYQGGTLLKRDVQGSDSDEGAGAYGEDVGHGGTGHDELYGQLGDDTLEGNEGDDSLLGDLGVVETSVYGGTAPKQIAANGFIKESIEVPGTLKRATTLAPNPGSVTSGGAGGDDTILGGLGNDVVHGGAGDDTSWGNRSLNSALDAVKETDPGAGLDEDVIFGDHGEDSMWGGWGHDRLYGGHGSDLLDMVTKLNGTVTGDKTVDFKGVDFMFGGWGADGMQADISQPSPSHGVDKMVDSTGVYNGYFVCEGAYGGNSIMRLMSPAMVTFWQQLATSDGLTGVGTSGSSGWWELAMVFNSDQSKNAKPAYEISPAHFICDSQ